MPKPKLPVPLEPLVDDRPPARSKELWAAIEATRSRTARARALLPIAAALACAALLGALFLPAREGARGRGNLLLAGQGALPKRVEPQAGYVALDLADGSRITVAQAARLDVLESSARFVSLALRTGRARFDVRPHGPRAWRIDCGVVTVEVVGTAFVIERAHDDVSVRVLRGAVLVRGGGVPDGVQRLDAGGTFASAPISATKPQRSAASIVEPDGGAAAETRDAPPAAAPARSEQRPDANVASRREQELERLWRDVDEARTRGEFREAARVLERLMTLEAVGPRAALAAFTLGKVELDKLDAAAVAASHLERALALRLPDGLEREARVRLVRAHLRAGADDAACTAARALARAYPDASEAAAALASCPPEPVR